MEKIAIVGTGVAGLGCAWQLRHHAEVTLFEKDPRPGGHTNTVDVEEAGQKLPVDTGFIVFNRVTYPHLCALFSELGVKDKPAEMSFSVRHDATGLEYNGMGFNKVFAQRRNLASPRFWSLIRKITKFFRVAKESLGRSGGLSMRDFVEKHGLGRDFLDLYLVPMSSAVWSTDPSDVLDFPAETLIRFFDNHGFLGVDTHHRWLTVEGGARTYLRKILDVVGAPRLAAPVAAVEVGDRQATVRLADGSACAFDRVILACHADQARALLPETDREARELLGNFRYQHNPATLHTWEGVMPRRRLAWASWNYRVTGEAGQRAKTHYWMNALQGVSEKQNYFVSLNSRGEIPASHILYETDYEHPVFTRDSVAAQSRLPGLNERSPDQRVFFCGSYFRYGFHEDAYGSAVALTTRLRECLGR
ncbi:MAG: FAD-dependent oxidoreductase [Terrimicrobiaceae bacterium]